MPIIPSVVPPVIFFFLGYVFPSSYLRSLNELFISTVIPKNGRSSQDEAHQTNRVALGIQRISSVRTYGVCAGFGWAGFLVVCFLPGNEVLINIINISDPNQRKHNFAAWKNWLEIFRFLTQAFLGWVYSIVGWLANRAISDSPVLNPSAPRVCQFLTFSSPDRTG